MALEYDLFIRRTGNDPALSIVRRPADVSDDDYKEFAHLTAQSIAEQLGISGVTGVKVTVVELDAMTREELDFEFAQAHAIEAAGGHLPSTDEILSQ